MTTIRALMTEDHRHCDDLFADAESTVGKKAITEAKTGMSMGPTQVMRMEDTQIRALLDEALEALMQNKPDDYLGYADTLVIMMQQHNMKVENMLYMMCDQHLCGETPELLVRLQTELAVA